MEGAEEVGVQAPKDSPAVGGTGTVHGDQQVAAVPVGDLGDRLVEKVM